jgi:hypothetical protein
VTSDQPVARPLHTQDNTAQTDEGRVCEQGLRHFSDRALTKPGIASPLTSPSYFKEIILLSRDISTTAYFRAELRIAEKYFIFHLQQFHAGETFMRSC